MVHYPAAFDSEDAPSAPVPTVPRPRLGSLPAPHPRLHAGGLDLPPRRHASPSRVSRRGGVQPRARGRPRRRWHLRSHPRRPHARRAALARGDRRARLPAAPVVRARALSAVARLSETDRSFILHDAIDVRAAAFVGFSAGAALAVYAAEASQTLWPGAVRAVVALAPTTGDSREALEELRRRAPRLEIPIALVSGREDTMGGFDGLVALGDGASRAPRVGIVAEGATHCDVHPAAIAVRLARADLGAVAALDRHVASAFISPTPRATRRGRRGMERGERDERDRAVERRGEDGTDGGVVRRASRGDDLDRAGDGSASVTYAFDPRKKVGSRASRSARWRYARWRTRPEYETSRGASVPRTVRVTRVDAERDDADEFGRILRVRRREETVERSRARVRSNRRRAMPAGERFERAER